MDRKSHTSRFAQFGPDGEIEALVAEGLPEWPADSAAEGEFLSALTDEQVGELHDAYMAQVDEIATALEAEDPEADAELAVALVERIESLRSEAERRMSAAPPEADPPAEPPAADPPADPPPPAAATGPDALARIRGLSAADPPAVQPTEVISAEDMAAIAAAAGQGAAEGIAPLAEAVTALATTIAERVTTPAAPAAPLTARDLGRYRPETHEPGDGGAPAPIGQLVHTGDVPNMQPGQPFETIGDLGAAMIRRFRDLGRAATDDDKVQIASFRRTRDVPAERDLRRIDPAAIRSHILSVVGPEAIGRDPWNLQRELPLSQGGIAVTDDSALVASGGLAAPVEPYYGQLCLAQADEPTFGAMPGFVVDRGGIRLVQPATIGTLAAAVRPGAYSDGVTNTDTSFVSATAAFTDADAGKPIIGAGVPTGTIINTVTNGTTVVLSAATTASATGVAFYLPARNPLNLGGAVGLVTAAEDAAGPPNSVKYTYDVPDGSQVEFDVFSVYTSLQYGNLTARTFPEQVELNILLANALAARVSEQAVLDTITNWSTLVTLAKTFGTARQLLAQWEHMAAWYRWDQRMNPAAVLRLGIPAWALNAMRGDYISTFIGGGDSWGLSDEELYSWFADRHILPFFYWDGPSDISQLFATIGAGAVNTGENSATPVALPDYPGTGSTTSFRTKVVSYMWGEGTWAGITTGELNIGLVRDSILNSQNKFRNFEEKWLTPAFVGGRSLRAVHTVAADGTYGAAASVVLGAGNGL